MKTCIAILLTLLLTGQASASVIIYGNNGNHAAEVAFSQTGLTLQAVLTNTSTFDVLVPSDVLTGVFFNSNGTLTPISATLTSGSTVVFGPDGGGNVGGEWAYEGAISPSVSGFTRGISSAGFGIFGNFNFGGPDLNPPNAVNGLNYGIISAGDNIANGNAKVTGQVPLIKNSVTFTFSVTSDFELSSITSARFQYGTALDEGNILVNTPPVVPEPTSLAVFGALGLTATSLLWKRRRATN